MHVHSTRLLNLRRHIQEEEEEKSLEGTHVSGRSTILIMEFSVVGHIKFEWEMIVGACVTPY